MTQVVSGKGMENENMATSFSVFSGLKEKSGKTRCGVSES